MIDGFVTPEFIAESVKHGKVQRPMAAPTASAAANGWVQDGV
mgnify:CR=1 FL=1